MCIQHFGLACVIGMKWLMTLIPCQHWRSTQYSLNNNIFQRKSFASITIWYKVLYTMYITKIYCFNQTLYKRGLLLCILMIISYNIVVFLHFFTLESYCKSFHFTPDERFVFRVCEDEIFQRWSRKLILSLMHMNLGGE